MDAYSRFLLQQAERTNPPTRHHHAGTPKRIPNAGFPKPHPLAESWRRIIRSFGRRHLPTPIPDEC